MTTIPGLIDPSGPTALTTALHELGMPCGDLAANVTPTLHRTFTDWGRFFVKTSAAEERYLLANEIFGAQRAARFGINAPVPVSSEPFAVGEEFATAWAHLQPCTAPPLDGRVTEMIEQMAVIASHPTTDLAFFDFGYHERRINWAGGPADLLRHASTAFAVVRDRVRPDDFVWIHGDAHLDNQLWLVSGRSVLIDWEFTSCGPIEWDLAQLLRSILVTLRGYHHSERTRCARLAVELAERTFAPDWVLVEAIIAARNVTGRTFRAPGAGHAGAVALDTLLDAGLIASLRAAS